MAIELLKNPDARNDPPRPLLEHLMALRDMIVFAALSWVACAVVACVFSPSILEWLKSPAAEDVEMLQDMVIAAVNEALRKAEDAANQNMSRLTGGLNLGF